MSDDAAVSRGQRAARELKETEAGFEAVKAAILAELVNTSPSQPDKILKLHLAVQNLEAVKAALWSVVNEGQIAAHALATARLTSPYT